MADQVRVAPDRRREVAVARRLQPVVADVARRVVRLLERSQHERGERRAAAPGAAHVRVDQPRDLAHQIARLLRRHRVRERRRRHVERGELRDQVLDACRVGPLVDAVERRQLARLQQPGDRLVCGDHQVLDQAVRLGLLARRQPGHVALVREVELRLDGLHGQRPARLPCRVERRRGGTRGLQRPSPRGLCELLAGEDTIDARVVQPRVGADQRAVECGAHHGRPVEVELDRDREPVLMRDQRAGVVGERLGQHRLDLAGDVHARRAPERLPVDGRAGRHVRGDVGDVHPDADRAALEPLGADRVVVVACGRRVDRERRQIAQVAAGGVVAHPLGGGTRLTLDLRVEAAPQAAVEHQRLEHVARDVRAADPPQHAPVAGARAGRRDQHEVAGAGVRIRFRPVDVHPPPAGEEGLGGEEAAAPLEHRDDRRGAAASSSAERAGCGGTRLAAGAHVCWRATVLTATSSASSRSWVLVSSSALTSGWMPAPCLTPPPPRLRPLGVKYSPTVMSSAPPLES